MLRDLCRYKGKLTGNRVSEKNRIQNSLTVSNIALANVVSDTFGKTASKIIDYILTCDVFDVEHCKTLISSNMKAAPDEIIKSVLGYNLPFAQASKIQISREHLAAVKSTKNTYFRDKFLRIKKRRGHKEALIAIARMM